MNRSSRFFGDYELLNEVARGGMGIVYRARQVSLDRIVALKMLRFGELASQEFVTRFRIEAQSAARLQHPNIVAIHEVGEHNGHHYFTMDFVEGKDLAEVTRDHPLPPERAAKYVQKIAEAIHYAHTRGVLHRDLKPSNVLIDANDQPLITDFGLAKQLTGCRSPAIKSGITLTGQVLGSPAFMPPEQAGRKHAELGPSSDVYSLGALLFALVSGRPPFIAETLEGILFQVLQAEPLSPRLLNPTVPRDLETICLKCLEKDPRRRYLTAKALSDDLACFLRGDPISARPLNLAQKVGRWCQRQPAVATLVLITTLLLMTGTSLVLWEWRLAESKAEEERHRLYVSDTAGAFEYWNEGDLMSVLRALTAQRPKPGETDLRGFEWRHLWWLSHHSPALTLPARNQAAGALAFSSSGKILAACYWDDILRFWDLDTPGRELYAISNATGLGAFVGNGDEYIVGTHPDLITIRRTKTGQIIRSIPVDGDLVSVAGDAQSVATINSNNVLKVLDLRNGNLKFLHPGKVRRRSDYSWGALVALSSDGQYLAVVKPGSNLSRFEDAIELWSVNTGEQLKSTVQHSQIRCLVFAPGGGRLALGNGDGSVDLWDFIGRTIRHFAGEDLPVLSLAFSPNGQTLAVGGADENIEFLNLTTGAREPQALRGPVGQVWALAFSPDGERLASGTRNSPISIWALNQLSPRVSLDQLPSHQDWGNFTFSPNSQLMAAACKGGVIKIWDVQTLALVAALPEADYVVAFSGNGKELLISTNDRRPMWWDFEAKAVRPIREHDVAGVRSVDLSPDRRLAALGFENGTIELLELDSKADPKIWPGHRDAVLSLKFTPQGDKLISGSRDRSIVIWEVTTLKRLAANDPGEHRGAICSLACSRDGQTFASGCGADLIKLWAYSNLKKPLDNMPYHKARVRTLDFSPDGKTLASGGDDRTVRLFSVAQKRQITKLLVHSPVRLVMFSPDGNNLAIITDAGELQLLRASPLELADQVASLR